MKVLVACEFSGTVRDAFIARGHDATSCDLLETESPGSHYKGDVENILWMGWDLMIAHPPCTYLCNSGVHLLYKEPERWKHLIEGAVFFRKLLHAPIPHIAVENPIMHKYAVQIIGRRQDQVIQPWMFGHTEQKATCLWLKELPELKPTKIMENRRDNLTPSGQNKLGPSADRWKLRSKTYQGIADAMANQWGNLQSSLLKEDQNEETR